MRWWLPARRTLARSAGCSGYAPTCGAALQTAAALRRRPQPSAQSWPRAAPHGPKAMGAAISTASSLISRGQAGSNSSGTTTAAAAASSAGVTDAGDGADGMWLIVGLGNPGSQYENTRHNVGFQLVDELARAQGVKLNKLQEGAAVARCSVNGHRVLLAKPMSFMNNSGGPVRKLMNFYKVPISRLLVVYDDLDLPTAKVRLRAKGGHGGHNGMRSIVSQLGGNKDFPRIRVGIGRPPGQMAVPTYVLQAFNKAEREEVDIAVQEGIDTVRTILQEGIERALSGVRPGAMVA